MLNSKVRRYISLRTFLDRVFAAVLLVVLSPVFVIVAVLIRLRMGKPIMFRQRRVGQLGVPFTILKFRTMINDAERIGGGYISSQLNLVPPLGRFLRSSSLDELPQLINIFNGDMSFVGPRPALPEQYSRYTVEQARRVLVPQGITGLAQVTYRNEAPWSLRIRKDLDYIENISFVTDVKLLVRTGFKVLRADGILSDQTAAEVDDLGHWQLEGKNDD